MQSSTTESKEKQTKSKHDEAEEGESETRQITRLVLVGIASGVSAYGTYFLHNLFPYDIIAIVAVLLGGYPVFKETILSLRHFRISMEVSMAVAVIASLLVEQFAVSVLITFFVLLSEFIEDYAVDKGRQTIVLLEKSAPKKALVRRNGIEKEVDVQSLETNDIVLVKDGERIPVDGTIVVGSAFVNQAAITGESQRFEKNSGDHVYTGSISCGVCDWVCICYFSPRPESDHHTLCCSSCWSLWGSCWNASCYSRNHGQGSKEGGNHQGRSVRRRNEQS